MSDIISFARIMSAIAGLSGAWFAVSWAAGIPVLPAVLVVDLANIISISAFALAAPRTFDRISTWIEGARS